MKKFLAMIFVLTFLFSVCFAKEQPAVQVGDFSYSAAEVQTALNTALQAMYASAQETPSEEDRKNAAQTILESFVLQGILESECKRLRLDTFDNDLLYDLREQAQAQYETYWQNIRNAYSAEDVDDATISNYLALCGITVDSCYNQLRLEELQKRYIEKKKIQVELSDEDVTKYYEEQFVQPYREKYENDIPLFEEEVLYGDGPSLYTPEGYREIHSIFLEIPTELREKMDSLEELAATKTAEAEKAYDEIAQLAIAGENAEEARLRYLEANSAAEQALVDYNLTWSAVVPALADTTDKIYARIDTGEAFDDLIPIYSTTNNIYYWHAGSEMWPDEMRTAILGLSVPGDVSRPVMTDDGVYIFYYAGDIEGGSDELTPEHRELVRSTAEYQLKTEKMQEMLLGLRDKYTVQTNIYLLQY